MFAFSSLFSFQTKKLIFKKKKKKKVPDPVSSIHVIAKSDSAIVSWEVPKGASNYHVYLVVQEMLIPINNGEGLSVFTPQVTLYGVLIHFFFFLKSKICTKIN